MLAAYKSINIVTMCNCLTHRHLRICSLLLRSLIKVSRRYRSVVRACILDLEEKAGMLLYIKLCHPFLKTEFLVFRCML